VKPKDFAVHADIAKAETLPAAAFTDPSVLERELETIFRREWLLVPEPTGAEARAPGPSACASAARARPCRCWTSLSSCSGAGATPSCA
jgi:hypothetical protein